MTLLYGVSLALAALLAGYLLAALLAPEWFS